MPALAPTSNPYQDQGDQSDGFIVRVYNKHFEYQGILGGYESLRCVKRHNAISTAELVVRADHPRVPELLLAGARLVIDYDHELLLSGRMESRGASANAGNPLVTFNVVSDFQYLNLMLGWPRPDADITQQGHYDPDTDAKTPYWRDEGIASNVAQRILQHAKLRTGLNMTVFDEDTTYADIGESIHIHSRMDTLADVLVAKLDRAGCGISIGGYGTNGQLFVGFYAPVVREKPLTADSGALVDWSWSQAEPTATRVVLGGAGEGTEREYYTFTHPDRETQIGTIKEVYVDARDIGSEYEEVLKSIPGLLKDKIQAAKDVRHAQMAVIAQEGVRDHAFLLMLTYAPGSNTPDDDNYALWTSEHNDRVAILADLNETMEEREEEYSAADAAYDAAIVRRDLLQTWVNAAMSDRVDDVLYEHKTQYGLSLTLAETPGFRYGTTFKVGDTVTVELPGSITITDTVREVTISDTVEQGLLVEPVIGTQETMDNPQRVLIGTVKRLMASARRLNTSR